MSGRIGWMVGVVACATFPWGCGLSPANTLPSGARPMVGPSPSVAPPVSSNQYRIGPEDVLDIVVWKNADLSKSVTVRPDGMVTLP
ncbi:MAG: polysaccharide biosynthesis/export family protein, partial [Nitrospiria bacterium]